ncbi:hypothetical protein B7991_02575 [Fibrobacter sp. UWB3]|nr:hypothetical protein B7991_02575 [Fibrobacter sp. UWB3]
MFFLRHSEQREDNSEGECCKKELTLFYNRAKELGRSPIQLSLVLRYQEMTGFFAALRMTVNQKKSRAR